jgi:peroxiredoxin
MLILTIFFLGVPQVALAGVIRAGVRKAAPKFTLRDSKGATVKLSQYKGKVVLLDFWATYCGVCKAEIPWYVKFQQGYAARGLAIIGVSLDTNWKAVRPFMAEEKMDYPVVIGNWPLLGRFVHIQALPVTFLIDRDGKIAVRNPGLINRKEFDTEIRELLGERKKP